MNVFEPSQFWHVGWFDSADETLTAAIPNPVMNAVGDVVTSPAFTYSLAAIG